MNVQFFVKLVYLIFSVQVVNKIVNPLEKNNYVFVNKDIEKNKSEEKFNVKNATCICKIVILPALNKQLKTNKIILVKKLFM